MLCVCYYYTLNCYRVHSSVCVVPFSKPSVAPFTDEQQEAFDELDQHDGLMGYSPLWPVLEDKDVIQEASDLDVSVVYCLLEATSAVHAFIQTTNFSEIID